MVFDAFDFNDDQYIDYQDAYRAMWARKNSAYDSDLTALQA